VSLRAEFLQATFIATKRAIIALKQAVRNCFKFLMEIHISRLSKLIARNGSGKFM